MKSTMLLLLLTLISAAHADISDTADCVRPIKPLKFTSNKEVDNFNNDVQTYQSCINTFISKHKDNIDRSTKAINKAIAEWNTFVNINNAKKDANTYSITGQTGANGGTKNNAGYSDPTTFSTNIKF